MTNPLPFSMKFSSFVFTGLAAVLLFAPIAGQASESAIRTETRKHPQSREGAASKCSLTTGGNSSEVSRDVLREINRLRTNPQAYADYLETLRPTYRADGMIEVGRGNILLRTHEGVSALNEAIRCLRKMQPLPPLGFSSGLTSAARDHVTEQGGNGAIGHGSNPFARMDRYGVWHTEAGENIAYGALSAQQIVANLVIDDGVSGRGHRKNLLKPAFGVAGVGVGSHPRFGRVCVIDFAGDFSDR